MREKTKKPRLKKNNIPIKSTAEAIGDIENALGNEPVVIYIADRSIGPWDVLPMFTQLSNKFSNTGKVNNLNLILDSGGGFPDDAYKIADIIHEFCDTLTVIVPLKAKSAATLLSLAGKKILMGPISELGPCDPMIGVDESLLTPSGIPVRPIGDEEIRTKKKTKQMNALALRDFLEAAGILIRDDEGKITGYHCEKLLPFLKRAY
jgi:membrane-bound ClpP family serine protease